MEEMETYIDMDIIGNKLDYIINLDSGFSEEHLHAFSSFISYMIVLRISRYDVAIEDGLFFGTL